MTAENISADELVMQKIALECPDCGRKHKALRCEEDPPNAVKAWIVCPECWSGGFGTTQYEDAEGREVHWDTADSTS